MDLQHIRTVTIRLLVYSCSLAFCLAAWALALGLLFVGCDSRADTPSLARLRWDIETSRPAPNLIELWRGETVEIQPRFLSYRQPMVLDDAYEVVIRYRHEGMDEGTFHALTGALHQDTGRIDITWTPAAETAATNYVYSIAVKSIHGDTMRAFGGIRLRGSVIGDPAPVPQVLTTLDFSTVEILNAQDAPFLTDVELGALQAAVSTLQTGKVDVVAWQAGNAVLQASIDDAAAMANMGGDISGVSTQAVVTGIQTIPVANLAPNANQDGYGLKYDHATGLLMLGPVATEGTSISNILTLVSVAQATDVGTGQIGLYRIIRPGNLPSAVINVNGAEVAWFDLLGMTMRQGTIHLLGNTLTANPSAYDGTAALPAYTWAAQPGLGKYRFSTGAGYAEGFAVDGARVWYWDANGIHLEPGKSISGASAESDPLSVHRSSTVSAWTHSGGTYATNAVVATSPVLSNGVQRVEYESTGPLQVVIESSTDGTAWAAFEASSDPIYVRVSVAVGPPPFGDPDSTVSNIVAYSWSRPDLVGGVADTAGQVVLVDNPAQPRQAVNKQSLDSAVATVTPAAWSDYPAQSAVRLDGHKLMLGGGWSLTEESGLGYLSYADVEVSTNGLTIANNGGIIMTAQGGVQGLNIAGLQTDGTNVTINVSTNGVTSQPIIQWTPSLSIIDWQSLTPVSETYPGTTNGTYQIIVELPASPAWFRAVRETGAARIDFHAPTYAEGLRVSARPIVSTDPPSSHTPAYAGHQLITPGATNRIYTAFGPTSSDWQLTWEGVAP